MSDEHPTKPLIKSTPKHLNIVLTLAKPQYPHPGFGYFKVDFKAPKFLPKVHFIETRRITLSSNASQATSQHTYTLVHALHQTLSTIATSSLWNTACLIRKAVNTFEYESENPKPASLSNAFRRADNFIDVPNQFIPFDLDAIPVDKNEVFDTPQKIFAVVDAFISKYLPTGFHNTKYVLQLTPSFRPIAKETNLPKTKLHVRIYFISRTPVYTAQLHNYPWAVFDDDDKDAIGLEHNKIHCCIDRSIYRPCQPIYIANPQFNAEIDPLANYSEISSRWLIASHHPSDIAQFNVDHVPFVDAKNQRNEIRSIMHMSGIEGAYCRQTDWGDLLPQFGYYQNGFDSTRWISPQSGSDVAGVVVNRDGRVWSHHSPEHCMIARTGRMLTAFDFMREFIFGGNYKAAVAYAAPSAKKDRTFQEEQNDIANTTIRTVLDFIDSSNYNDEAVIHEYDGLMSQTAVYKIILEEIIRGSLYDYLGIDKTLKILAEKLVIEKSEAKAKYTELKQICQYIYDDVAKREARAGRLNFLLPKATDETNAMSLINAYGGQETLRSFDEMTIYAFRNKFWREFRGLLSHKILISEYTLHDPLSLMSLNDSQKVQLTKSFHTEIIRNTKAHDPSDSFVIGPNIIPLKNCVIDISNWLPDSDADLTFHTPFVRGYLPQDHVLSPLTFNYDPEADCPKFKEFVKSIYPDYPELVEMQQMKFGYVLTTGNIFQKIFMQRGERRSGKGTLDRVLSHLVPRGYFEPTTFEKLSGRFGQSVFKKAKIVNIPDYKKGTLNAKSTAMVEEVIISATGGDMIAVEEKFGRQEGIKPVAVLTISSNEILDIQNINAFFSRLIVLPHMISFEGAENFNLENELLEELPGILNWALEGLYKLGRLGRFPEPEISKIAKEEMIESLNPMSAFIRRFYFIDKKAANKDCVSKDGLKNSFLAWMSRDDTSMTPEEIDRYSETSTINSYLRAIIGTIDPKKRTSTKNSIKTQKPISIKYGVVLKPEIREIRDWALKRVKDPEDLFKYATDEDDISVIFDERYCDLEVKLSRGSIPISPLDD